MLVSNFRTFTLEKTLVLKEMETTPKETQPIQEIQNIRASSKENEMCADCLNDITTHICIDYSTFICDSCADIHSRVFRHRVKEIFSYNLTQRELQMLRLGGNKSVNDAYLAKYSKREKLLHFNISMKQHIQQKYIDKTWFKLSATSKKQQPSSKSNYNNMIFSGYLLKPSENKSKSKSIIWATHFAVLLSDKTLRFYDRNESTLGTAKLKLDLKKIKYITKTPKPSDSYGSTSDALFFYVSESMLDPYGYQFGCKNYYQYQRWMSNIQTIISENKAKYSLFKNELLIHGYCRIYSNNSYFPRDILSLIVVWFKGGWDLITAHKHIEIGASSIKRVKKPDAKMINVFSAESIGFGEKKIWKLQFKATDPNKSGKPSSAQIGVIDGNKAKSKMNDSFANKINGGYAYGGWTGNIYHGDIAATMARYGPPLRVGDIIEVELDMRKDKGTLSFKVNGISKGVAFDDLKKTKQYKLAVALKWREHFALILD